LKKQKSNRKQVRTKDITKKLTEAGIRKSLNETEHYQFINMVFAHWNDKNRHCNKRSAIEILGFYSAVQDDSEPCKDVFDTGKRVC
jgi:hypothetical protein